MSIDLSGFTAIQVANFVRLDIPGYTVVRVSDFNKPLTVAGENYTDIGRLLNIGETFNEVRVLDKRITVSISGIPAGSVSEFLNNNPRTSRVDIRQVYFDPTTETPLGIAGNPAIKFRGLVDNFSMTEEWNNETRSTQFTILLNCISEISYLRTTVAGRRTNDRDQKRLFSSDQSMSRVFTITKTQFQFGKPE
jgi:hypothetical protein